ncbi:MAG TPA: cytochrome C oxidase subunit II [Alphaproteobacteria bacterium]|jgi:cytochrome c oxidase subunit 2|nr:cytochrome C oxidase subunit II [Alphaproteobacteria bacterium]
MSEATHIGPDPSERVERRWATVSIIIVALLVVMAAFAGIHEAVMPQTRIETVDPRTLHIAGEFIESNLGSAVEPDGSVTVRAVGQQYSFTPQCMVVPTDTQITFRATSADVVHGFLIEHSNINQMLVPGYVSTIVTRFKAPAEVYMPCHEFCGVGHEGMWARIRIVDKAEFQKLAADRRRVDCVAQ